MFMDANVLMSRLVYHTSFRVVNGEFEKLRKWGLRPVRRYAILPTHL